MIWSVTSILTLFLIQFLSNCSRACLSVFLVSSQFLLSSLLRSPSLTLILSYSSFWRAQPSCEVLPVLAGAPHSKAGHKDDLDGGRCGP